VSSLCYLCVSTRRGVRADNLRRVFEIQARYLHLKSLPKGQQMVLDEGPVHAVFIALFGTGETKVSRFFLRFLAHRLSRSVRAYLCLEIPMTQIMTNLEQRDEPRSRFNRHMSEREKSGLLADRSYGEILRELSNADSARMIHLTAGADDVTADLIRALKNRVG
jgi:hypothetical protein